MTGEELVGFAEPIARFDLVDELQRVKEAETARIVSLAGRLSRRFGTAIGVGLLYHELLGRPPDNQELAGNAERVQRSPSSMAAIAEELLALAGSPNPRCPQ